MQDQTAPCQTAPRTVARESATDCGHWRFAKKQTLRTLGGEFQALLTESFSRLRKTHQHPPQSRQLAPARHHQRLQTTPPRPLSGRRETHAPVDSPLAKSRPHPTRPPRSAAATVRDEGVSDWGKAHGRSERRHLARIEIRTRRSAPFPARASHPQPRVGGEQKPLEPRLRPMQKRRLAPAQASPQRPSPRLRAVA